MTLGGIARGAARRRAGDVLTPGARVHGFVVQRATAVRELDLVAFHLEHERTKARMVHVDCEDTNNAFAVAFRTPVSDSTGVPHILEHAVLCGSERFPVRDPFFNMTKRSLNTYMNALTASDHTMYPFATRNAQDFDNLLRVYLDAAFFPRLEEMDFQQEGHRLELDPEAGKCRRTGVVYNEMKGALGSASSLFYHRLQAALLPGTQYEHISGGDPRAIPSLTHEQLLQFHREHYHPSNALLFTYGDLPVEQHLKTMDEFALSRFSFSPEAAEVKEKMTTSAVDRSRLAPGKVQRVSGPPDPMLEEQGVYCMSRVLQERALDREGEYERMVCRVLSTLLLDGSSAPLYEALIDSQLAPEFSPGTGYDGSSLHPTFGIGVQGIKTDEETLKALEDAVLQALRKVCAEGLDERRVEAVLHQFELSLKNKQTTFGLMVMHALAGGFAHAPFHEPADLMDSLDDGLKINDMLDRLAADRAADPDFWVSRVKEMLLAEDPETRELTLHPDLVRLAMDPDEAFTAKLQEEEESQTAIAHAALGDDGKRRVAEDNARLKAAQAEPQDPSCLPTLSVADVSRTPEEILQVAQVDGNELLWVADQKTNGVVYMRLMFDTSGVPNELLPLVSVLTSLLGAVDAGDMSYQDLSVNLDLSCDGLNTSHTLVPWHAPADDTTLLPRNHQLLASSNTGGGPAYRQGVVVSTASLSRNLDRTLDLVARVLQQSRFGASESRLNGLLATAMSSASGGIGNGALSYARLTALASLRGEHAKREALKGLSQVEMLFDVAKRPMGIVPALEALMAHVFRPDNMTACVVAGGNEINKEQVLDSVRAFKRGLAAGVPGDGGLAGLPRDLPGHGLISALEALPDDLATYVPLPIQVHNASASVTTPVCLGHQDDAAMMLLGQLLSSNFLHRAIRESGGAYGGGAAHDLGGLFAMSSYFDPRAEDTLRDFSRGLQWLCEGSFHARDVDEALLSMFGAIDSPQETRTKGSGAFLYGISQDKRQALRDRLFDLDRDKLVAAANRHLKLAASEGFLEPPFAGKVAIAGKSETAFARSAPGWRVRELRQPHE